MNRGLEISSAAADGVRSVVLDQVQAGVSVRMAVLYRLLAGAGRGGRYEHGAARASRPLGGDAGRRADRGRRDRRRSAPRLSGDDVHRRRRAGAAARASSTCTPTCASRAARTPRRSRPARPRPRSAGSPPCTRWPTPTRSPTPPRSSSRSPGAAREVGLVDVRPVGAVSQGPGRRDARRDRQHGPLGARAVRVFSDDGRCVHDARLMRRALEYVKPFDAVVAQHAQDPRLADSAACAHEGELSGRLGLPGWPAVAEESIIARDVMLAEHTGSRLHVCHVSTGGSVEVIRWAKQRGIAVTAEVTPHHLLLTCDLLETYDPVYKVNPPLRPADDVEALRAGAGRRHDRRRRHRPRAARRARQGPRVRRRRVRHARPRRPRSASSPRRWSTPGCSTGPAWPTGCRVRPARDRPGGRARRARSTSGAPANLTLVDPTGAWTVDPAALASQVAQHPVRRAHAARPRVVATLLRGRLTVLRRPVCSRRVIV